MFKNILFAVLTVLDLILIAGSVVILPFSVMMFDAGETPILWAKFYGLVLIPVTAFVCIIAGLLWLLAFKQQNTALWLVGAPLIYVVLWNIFAFVA